MVCDSVVIWGMPSGRPWAPLHFVNWGGCASNRHDHGSQIPCRETALAAGLITTSDFFCNPERLRSQPNVNEFLDSVVLNLFTEVNIVSYFPNFLYKCSI